MKANSFRIAFQICILPLVVVVFQAACFAGDASQAAPAAKAQGDQPVYDVVVYGDSSGAVIAAVAAKREGRSVILVNPTGFPGGMSASGLGATDFLGKRNTFGGIASEFYDGIAAAYGTNYIRSFEPHVGKQVFEKMITDAGVPVAYNERLDRTSGKGVKMNGRRIESITTLSGKTYRGKMFIDATYVGDLMAAAGVTYTVGREPESQYGEDMAGVRRGDTKPRVHYTQGNKDHFIKDVDPYVKPGDTNSGLLPYVFRIDGLANGQGDKKIQAYNYRVCLTTDPTLRIPIEKPADYREIDHELLLRNFDAGDERLPALIEPLAGGKKKVDWNNMHAVGSDLPGANWDYPEASYERRHEIEKEHETYIRGFLWTMANNPRVPEAIRKKTAAYGLAKDEFTDNGGWPWMIYIREARRMVGDYVMTQHDGEGKKSAPDPVALGSFGMDSHVVQHFVNESGHVISDGVIWRVPPKPYGISYRSIIPRKSECENLFSPICVSASHVAHGSIRMEPVFMALSQSAAIAAGLALDNSLSVQDVAYEPLREKLEAAKQIVHPGALKDADRPNKAPPRRGPAAQTPANGATSSGDPKQKLNVLFILADDLGYGDVSCYNDRAKVPTPNLDRLARDGMRFTDAHSPATVCTPSRYSLMTGQMAFRVPNGGRVFEGVGGPSLIAPGRLTLPAMLRAQGYATACVGKWHVGLTFFDKDGQPIRSNGVEAVRRVDFSRRIEGGPLDHGFDRFFGTACCPATDYLYAFIDGDRVPVPPTRMLDKSKLPKHPYAFDNRAGLIAPDFDLEELDMVFLKKSREFLEQHTKSQPEKPFFLLHSMNAVHLPSFASKQFQGSTKAGPHGDFIHELDHIVGDLMKTLERLGMADRTVVMFSSDNGPETTAVVHMRADYGHDGARPWRGLKRDQWEGGHRVPFLVRWPGKVKPGTTSAQLTSLTDVMATVAAIIGTDLPKDAAEDSFNLLPALLGKDSGPIRPYLLQQAFGGPRTLSIRRGNWKYLDHPGSGGNRYDNNPELKPFMLPDTAPGAPGQLYNLEADPGEANNLYLERPQIVKELKALLDQSKASGRSRPERPTSKP